MDPFIISLVGAVAAGAAAATKDTATEELKNAYAGIRQYIKDRYATVQLEALESDPTSKVMQLAVQRKLEETVVTQDTELPTLLKLFVETLRVQAPDVGSTIGIELENIRAEIDVQVRRVGGNGSVKIKGVGARRGSVTIEDIGYHRKN